MSRWTILLGALLAASLIGCEQGTAADEAAKLADTAAQSTETSTTTTATAMNASTETQANAEDVMKRMPKEGEEVAVLETAQGRIVIMFFADKAPNHVNRFKECIREGIYAGTYFHRVIPGFMIQGGDPNTKNDNRADDGTGGHGDMLKAEFNEIKHVPGILSAARTSDPNSAQSQFFLMHGTSPHLDRQYTVYGRVLEGLDVIDKIVKLPKDNRDNPVKSDDARIKTARLEKWPIEIK